MHANTEPNMNSSVTSYVAGEVVSKSLDDFSSAVGKFDFSAESIPGLTPSRCSDEEYKRLLKHREKLRAQHLKMEADRQAMRRKILMKYGMKESDRHKSVLSSEFSNDEKELLVGEESREDESESCLSCISCCFKTK